MVNKSVALAVAVASIAAGVYWSNKKSKATHHHVDQVAADMNFVSCDCVSEFVFV